MVLRIEIRNLSSDFVVISSPYIKLTGLRPGPFAHLDSPSGEFEIKFRRNETDDHSEVACLLRHRDTALSYLPLDENQTDDQLLALSKSDDAGTLCLDLIHLGRRPRVKKISVKLSGMSLYKGREHAKKAGVPY